MLLFIGKCCVFILVFITSLCLGSRKQAQDIWVGRISDNRKEVGGILAEKRTAVRSKRILQTAFVKFLFKF